MQAKVKAKLGVVITMYEVVSSKKTPLGDGYAADYIIKVRMQLNFMHRNAQFASTVEGWIWGGEKAVPSMKMPWEPLVARNVSTLNLCAMYWLLCSIWIECLQCDIAFGSIALPYVIYPLISESIALGASQHHELCYHNP